VQVGLTTADDRVRRLLEPNAAPVAQRLAALDSLIALGVQAEARIDPLTPGLTDTESSFDSLCGEIAKTGAKTAVASYLFLRRSNFQNLRVQHDGWSFLEISKRIYTERIEKYCGSGTIIIPATDYRKAKYAQLTAVAQNHGIQLSLCRCKNPRLVNECCHPLPSAENETTQPELF
jgi:DNA repair photolyase